MSPTLLVLLKMLAPLWFQRTHFPENNIFVVCQFLWILFKYYSNHLVIQLTQTYVRVHSPAQDPAPLPVSLAPFYSLHEWIRRCLCDGDVWNTSSHPIIITFLLLHGRVMSCKQTKGALNTFFQLSSLVNFHELLFYLHVPWCAQSLPEPVTCENWDTVVLNCN